MSRAWKPGDVAMVTWSGGRSRLMLRGTNGVWWEPSGSFREVHVIDARPLVVIDPEDREQVERLRLVVGGQRGCLAINRTGEMQTALREYLDPPKPEVFEHLAVEGKGGVARVALCGKVWRPSDRSTVNVVGKCPECSAVAESGWTA